jgi:enoyl-CoA hydratase/carnithine racemase
MSAQSNIRTSIENRVFMITIDHAPVNAIDPQTLLELERAVDEFLADPTCKVAIIASANQTVFVSGADIPVFAGMIKTGKIGEFVLRGQALFNKISASPRPFIAAINGLTLGGGLELAMCCHMRIASERAKLGLPEINLGIMPGWGGTQMLTRIVGRTKATEMILLGETISAQEALRLNLVNKVVPRREVLQAAKELANKIASKGDLAIRAAMESIRAATEMNPADGLAFEARQMTALVDTEDAQERINEFLEKHKPDQETTIG